METTTNFNLEKPAMTDLVSDTIGALADNFDKIDENVAPLTSPIFKGYPKMSSGHNILDGDSSKNIPTTQWVKNVIGKGQYTINILASNSSIDGLGDGIYFLQSSSLPSGTPTNAGGFLIQRTYNTTYKDQLFIDYDGCVFTRHTAGPSWTGWSASISWSNPDIHPVYNQNADTRIGIWIDGSSIYRHCFSFSWTAAEATTRLNDSKVIFDTDIDFDIGGLEVVALGRCCTVKTGENEGTLGDTVPIYETNNIDADHMFNLDGLNANITQMMKNYGCTFYGYVDYVITT